MFYKIVFRGKIKSEICKEVAGSSSLFPHIADTVFDRKQFTGSVTG